MFELGDGLFDVGPLRSRNLRIGKHPVGDKMAFEQSFGHAGFLRQRPEQFLGLLHLCLALSKAIALIGVGTHTLALSLN